MHEMAANDRLGYGDVILLILGQDMSRADVLRASRRQGVRRLNDFDFRRLCAVLEAVWRSEEVQAN